MNIILFENEIDEDNNGIISCHSAAYSHIINILHLREGDDFVCGIWGKNKGVGHIRKIDEKKIVFAYSNIQPCKKDIGLFIMLSYIRPICAKRVVRLAGEVGLSGIIFIPTILSEKSYKDSTFYSKGEYLEILKSGCEISSDSFKPEIFLSDSIDDGINTMYFQDIKNKYLLEKSENSIKLSRPESGKSIVAIGGERGWTKNEIEIFEKEGFQIRNIGERILRSEESAIVSVFPWL